MCPWAMVHGKLHAMAIWHYNYSDDGVHFTDNSVNAERGLRPPESRPSRLFEFQFRWEGGGLAKAGKGHSGKCTIAPKSQQS